MAEEEGGESKEFEPSQRRLDRAREEGDAIRSEEMQAAAATGGLLVALTGAGGWIVTYGGGAGMAFLDRPDTLRIESGMLVPALVAMAAPALLLLAGPAMAVLLWLGASRGLLFAPSRLAMKPSRLSPVANFRQKFGRTGLADFARRAMKMVAIGTVLGFSLAQEAGLLFTGPRMDAGQIALTVADLLIRFLTVMVILSAIFGLVDYLWQRTEFLRRNRMTRKEMSDETRESEGDPHLKADRRRRAQDVAARQMIAEVPKADVVILNPTHYAVALRWDRAGGGAPVCVAKGVDEMAARIRLRAQEAGIPLRRDPPTARALHATVGIGQEIRREHYAAVAAAIRFADSMRSRSRAPR